MYLQYFLIVYIFHSTLFLRFLPARKDCSVSVGAHIFVVKALEKFHDYF